MGRQRHVVAYLKDFMFDPDQVRQPAKVLSGGQKNRLMLAKTLASPKTCLILDEPTNDLDMETLDMLEEILLRYKGTLIIVSHDRDFLDQTVTKVLAFEGGGDVEGYIGGYSDYFEQKEKYRSSPKKTSEKNISNKSEKKQAVEDKPKESKRTFSFTEKDELKKLPKRIEKLEKEVADINSKLADPNLYKQDQDTFDALAKELKAKQASLASAESRWLELEELKG